MLAGVLRHEWPQWLPQDLTKIFPTLEPSGIDLMKRMMEYDPAKRISVSTAPFLFSIHTPHHQRAAA